MSSHKVVSQHVQDAFVLLAITDVTFLRMARTAIKSSYFSSRVTEDIVNLCYGFYDQFREAPGNHLHDELVRFTNKFDDDKTQLYLTYVERIRQMDPPNQKYIISSFNKFVQARELEEALIDAAPLVERGEFDAVKELLQRTLRSGMAQEDDGIEYPGNWPPTYQINEGFREVICPTGIRIIDKGIGGIKRGGLTSIFAGFKVGKTWGCIQLAMQALIAGKKVLEVSHEASAEEIEMRHDQGFGCLTDKEGPREVEFIEYDNEGTKIASHMELRESVFNMVAVKAVRDKVRRFGGKAIIKKYPMGTCSVGEIERYLDYLETFKRFTPDMLISDYVEKMKMPKAGEGRDAINETYINLKRIADERNIAVVTASQIKTKYLESSNITEAGAPAEDARKLGNIDLGLFFGMNRYQAERNLMQAYVLVNRSGPQKFGCVVSRNLAVGQLALNCWPIKFNEKGNK